MDATDLTARIARRAGNLIASLDANDNDRALEHARELRACLDALIADMTLAQFSTDAELSAAVHDDPPLSALEQARVDLARCVAARDAKRGAR